MSNYNNREGKVTALTQDNITIDDVEYTTIEWHTKGIISASQCSIGDPVIFNFNYKTQEIIFLRMKHPYYKGGVGRACRSYRTGPYGYVEDPRDPDEVHDMEAIYGHDFAGM